MYFVKGLCMKYVLGLDIGIASVGFAVVEQDDNREFTGISDAGVRVFRAAEQPKTGASLALPRREKRGSRRRLQRRVSRLYRLKQLFVQNGIITEQNIEELYIDGKKTIDVWNLRKDALERKLTGEEFYRCLMHIAKRRGFKSIRKSEEAKNSGALLKAIEENSVKFNQGKYRTIGEMYATLYADDIPKRNKRDSYKNSIPRNLLYDEVGIIFENQRKLGFDKATTELEDAYKNIAFYQRPLSSFEDKIGNCIFEKNEKRAPKYSYSAELFTAATRIVNTTIVDEMGNSRFFKESEILKLKDLAHINSKVTYAQAKKCLNLSQTDRFNSLNYNKKDKKTGELINPETSVFVELKGYHAIRKVIEKNLGKEYFNSIQYDKDLFNKIAFVLTCEKSDENIVKKMEELNIPNEIIRCVQDLSMSKVIHLSIKAIEKILPFMLTGMKYNEACFEAGYNHSVLNASKNKCCLLPVLQPNEMTTNPVVNRAISQTRKVINTLIKKYGAFDTIIVEMARDLSKSVNERREIEKAQEEFQAQKELARKRCIENGIDPDVPKSNLLKFRLWEEQNGYCMYSGKYIPPSKLKEPNSVQIDHIIPFSKSFDDSLNNKVLCLTDENQRKGNKIPYEHIGESNWHEFVNRIKMYNLKTAKVNRLTRKSYPKEDEAFKSRNLNDTRYMAKFIKDYIKENLDFDNNLKVETRNGAITAFLRTNWGLVKNRQKNDKHHAQDAVIIACTTQKMVQKISATAAQIEKNEYVNNKKPKYKKPWETFNEDIEKTISNIFVSRAIRAKISGEIHEETIRSAKHLAEGYTTLKTPIKKINLSILENMFDKERNIKIYEILKERLLEFDNDPKKAFEIPIYMPLSEEKVKLGQRPHEIKSIKIKDNGISGIKVNNGFASNSSIARLDVFKKENKKGKNEYFFVPVYVSDFGNDLPNKIFPVTKTSGNIDETYEFCFSLYQDCLISVNMSGNKNDEKYWYYRGFDISTGTITVDSNDREIEKQRISVKKAALIKKYQVGILGDIHEIKKEKRQSIKRKK